MGLTKDSEFQDVYVIKKNIAIRQTLNMLRTVRVNVINNKQIAYISHLMVVNLHCEQLLQQFSSIYSLFFLHSPLAAQAGHFLGCLSTQGAANCNKSNNFASLARKKHFINSERLTK